MIDIFSAEKHFLNKRWVTHNSSLPTNFFRIVSTKSEFVIRVKLQIGIHYNLYFNRCQIHWIHTYEYYIFIALIEKTNWMPIYNFKTTNKWNCFHDVTFVIWIDICGAKSIPRTNTNINIYTLMNLKCSINHNLSTRHINDH